MVRCTGYYMYYVVYSTARLPITLPNNKPITVIHNETPQFNDPLQLQCTITPLLCDTDGFHGVHYTKWINVHCYSFLLLDENCVSLN